MQSQWQKTNLRSQNDENDRNDENNKNDTNDGNDAVDLSEFEQDFLQKFHDKIDKFKHTLCPVCNESFPSIVLVKGECCRCYTEKTLSKKFSAENNMNPENVPKELQDLIEIKEMLITRVFSVMSIYRLRGGQYEYHGNVINFPQNV